MAVMSGQTHHYHVEIEWQGNRGSGTSAYTAYGRTHEVRAPGKVSIVASSDPAFRGEPDRWNPEEMLVATLAQCHMLSYLHEAVLAGVAVTAYSDAASGTMTESPDGGGHFVEAVLRPVVTVAEASMADRAATIHGPAGEKCFIAASVNFPVRCEPTILVQAPTESPAPAGSRD